MPHHLVTTALKMTWPSETTRALFLGRWCHLYPQHDGKKVSDDLVMPYHWNDRKKLHQDQHYCREVYFQNLDRVSAWLNSVHCENHQRRYWEIILGPWLRDFIEILFDRWSSIEKALEEYEIDETTVIQVSPLEMVPHDMSDFLDKVETDHWNHHLFSSIIEFLRPEIVKEAYPDPTPRSRSPKSQKKQGLALGQRVIDMLKRVLGMLQRDTNIVLYHTYLSPLARRLTEIKLRQVPQAWRQTEAPVTTASLRFREDELSTDLTLSPFESFLIKMIPRHIPTAYLEGYSCFCNAVEDLNWPSTPAAIFTSNAHNDDDLFKIWTATKVEKGSRLVIGQHGGGFGALRWISREEHELSVCDQYISWGWTENGNAKITPVGQFVRRKEPRGPHHGRQYLVLITLSKPRYSNRLYSYPISSQILDAHHDNATLVHHLPSSIKDQLIVRLYPKESGWAQYERWSTSFPAVKIDQGDSDLGLLLNQCRLLVVTYNGATFLESFTLNIPTVLYWNPSHSELRKDAEPLYKKLQDAGILHHSPNAASEHIRAVWQDVDGWWKDPRTVAAVADFCDTYCFRPANFSSTLAKSLLDDS